LRYAPEAVAGRRIYLSLVFYGLLAAAALGWGALRGDLDLYHHPEPWVGLAFPASTGAALGSGVVVALVVLFTTRVLVRHTTWARKLHIEFRSLLGPLGGGEIAVFALTSGIAEEMFFRGALQPAVGIVLSGVLFGLVHVGPRKTFLPWTLWAMVMGWVFGALYAATGELLAPVVAHVLINYENLYFIDGFDPTPPEEDRPRVHEPPRLVSPRTRD
jgi:membrane protease YdiL (CAAX protease family)